MEAAVIYLKMRHRDIPCEIQLSVVRLTFHSRFEIG